MADDLRLSIEKLVYGGNGLAHADGNTVFVPYVLPGEEVRASARKRQKKLLWADLLEVIFPAKERGQPKCPHFQKCGGCHYQHISAAEQLRLKKEILQETLSRLGGISWDGPIREHAAEPYGYRNRAQWAVRQGMPRALGYFLPESSVILPIDECPVLSPLLAETFLKLQDMSRAGTLPARVKEIEAFADSRDQKIALNVAFERLPIPRQPLVIFPGKSPFDRGFARDRGRKCTRRPGARLVRRSGILYASAGESVSEGRECRCESCGNAGPQSECGTRRCFDRLLQRTRRRVSEEDEGTAGVGGFGSAKDGTRRSSGQAPRRDRREGNCLSFVRSVHARS